MLIKIENISQAVKETLKKYEQLPKSEKERIEKEGEIREIYEDIKAKIIDLDYKGLEKYDENLALIVRIVKDYHFREALARNSEELQRLGEKFKQLAENVGKGHAIVGGIVAGLVASGIVSMGLGTVLGGIIALGASVIEPVKAISISGERMDDLGRRLDRIRNTRGRLSENIYWAGIELLHSRPKCRALTSSCAKEHLYKASEVDLFNKMYETLFDFYDKFTFEKFREQYNLQQIKNLQAKQEEKEIAGAVVYTEQKSKNLLIILTLGLITIFIFIFKK